MQMKPEHNHAKVGYSMIVVSASLAVIGLLALFIGPDVLYADNIQREKTTHFNECRDGDFQGEGCDKYQSRINTPTSGIQLGPGE